MNTMTYKSYTVRVEIDDRSNILVDRLLRIADIVSFHASNICALRAAFEGAVDDYLETCAKVGKHSEKAVSGKLMLRVPPEVHGAALVAAEAPGKSLNQWATEALKKAAGRSGSSQG